MFLNQTLNNFLGHLVEKLDLILFFVARYNPFGQGCWDTDFFIRYSFTSFSSLFRVQLVSASERVFGPNSSQLFHYN